MGIKTIKNIFKRLQEYAMQYYKLSEWQKSLRVFEKKYQVILKFGTIEEKTDVLKDIGVLQRNVQEYDKSIQTHKDALQHARELNNIELIYDILWELGITYMECNDWESALKTNFEIFQISDTNKWDAGKFISAERLGICYYNLKDIEKSVDYLDLSIVLGDSIIKNTSKSYYYIGKIEEDNELRRG
jgi:tetratricopeptide (TPR) repeat protein